MAEPTFLNLEFIFFLIWKFFASIGRIFGSLLFGKNYAPSGGGLGSGGGEYNLFDSNNYNPFLDVNGEFASFNNSLSGGVSEFFANLGQGIRVFLMFLALALIILLVYLVRKHRALARESNEKIRALYLTKQTSDEEDERWERIVSLVNSSNSSDWKVSIFEADVILDEMLIGMGYAGDNLGERLKAVEPSDFLTLQSAWRAHKVRNSLAHDGAYVLDQREAKRVIAWFEEVFKEFEFI